MLLFGFSFALLKCSTETYGCQVELGCTMYDVRCRLRQRQQLAGSPNNASHLTGQAGQPTQSNDKSGVRPTEPSFSMSWVRPRQCRWLRRTSSSAAGTPYNHHARNYILRDRRGKPLFLEGNNTEIARLRQGFGG